MDRYLTDETRSIPLAILLDRDFTWGRWGPAGQLQNFVRANLTTCRRRPCSGRSADGMWRTGNAMLREILQAVHRQDKQKDGK
jgi:hypothetical protein